MVGLAALIALGWLMGIHRLETTSQPMAASSSGIDWGQDAPSILLGAFFLVIMIGLAVIFPWVTVVIILIVLVTLLGRL